MNETLDFNSLMDPLIPYIDLQKQKRPVNTVFYGPLIFFTFSLVALPVQISNLFLMDLRRLANIAI